LPWLAWTLTTVFALLLLSQPISTQAQLAMSCSAMAAMTAIWLFWRGPRAQFVFLALGSLVVLRYIYWRISSTLPPVHDTLGFTFGFLLLLAELYCVFILFVSLIINADPLQRPALKAEDADLPTVDVFVPTYNEDEVILATTLAAARLMDYPADRLTIWLLDDGGTDQKRNDPNPAKAAEAEARFVSLQALCARMGAKYLTRARNLHAKAGNMNNALPHAKGEIVLVLDADHVPFRSLLRDTVGHFAADPRLFLVQTPHAFLNPDPIERNLRTFAKMPSENEMFYSITQRGLDKWNSSFFCGSAALLRREALDEAGGFSGITITEDCETAFELHKRGWTSVYVDKPLIAGLQPNTLSSFIGQRSRWCQGMIQIMLLKNPLFQKGLHPIQKLAYLSSMTFWFFPIPRLMFMFAPLLYVFFDMKIFVANVQESIAYTATYIVINLMIQNYLYGRVRWPFVSELYEYVQGIFLLRAIVSVIWSPRRPTFNVTSKSDMASENHLSELSFPFFAVFGILLVGEGVALYRYMFEPGITTLMLVVGLWNLFSIITAGAALGVVAERKQTELNPSLPIARNGGLTLNRVAIDVTIERVSQDGCTVRIGEGTTLGPLGPDNPGWLTVEPIEGAKPTGPLPVSLASRHEVKGETICELRFGAFRPADYFAFAGLMYGDSDAMTRFQRRRRKHKGLLPGIAQYIWWGLSEPVRAFRYLGIALIRRRNRPAAIKPVPAQAIAAMPPEPAMAVPFPEAGPLAPAAPLPQAALVPQPALVPQAAPAALQPHAASLQVPIPAWIPNQQPDTRQPSLQPAARAPVQATEPVAPEPLTAAALDALEEVQNANLEASEWLRVILDAENERLVASSLEMRALRPVEAA
jgi:cellulose synthase (UDP-forming)